jgi:hypothetical protein
LNIEKESIPDLFGRCHFFKQQDWLDLMYEKRSCFVFYFSSVLDYMYLFPKMNYMRSCCLACKYCALDVPIKQGETKFTRNFGYLEHPDISKFFWGPSNFEIEVFYCIKNWVLLYKDIPLPEFTPFDWSAWWPSVGHSMVTSESIIMFYTEFLYAGCWKKFLLNCSNEILLWVSRITCVIGVSNSWDLCQAEQIFLKDYWTKHVHLNIVSLKKFMLWKNDKGIFYLF